MTRGLPRSLCPRMALAAVLTFAVALTGIEHAAAGGGGGCHSTAISEAEGVRVEVRGSCFEPTVLRVETGGTVSWTNHDPVPHAVTGVNGAWGGYDQFSRDEEVSFRFDEPGTYPYWCVVHPSMIGAVVVGEGGPSAALVARFSGTGGLPQPLWLLAAFAAGAASGLAARSIGRLVRWAGLAPRA